MRNFMKTLAMMLALVVTPAVASAQNWAGNFTTGNTSTNPIYNNTYVGPYAGTLTSITAPTNILNDANQNKFWCLDFGGSFGGGEVRISSFAQVVAGNSALTTKFTNVARAIQYYEAGNNNVFPTTAAEVGAVHKFVWNQFSTNPNWSVALNQSLLPGSVDLNQFFLVEFDRTADGTFDVGSGRQELAFYAPSGGNLSTVPEPSTYALMTAGLLGLGVAVRRRKNAVKA